MTSRHGFLAGSGAAVLAARLNADAQSLIHLTVGTAPIDAGMPSIIGQKAGIFRRNGLDVDVQVMNSGAVATAAVIGGALNASGTSVMGVITAHLRGVPFQIIAPASVYVSDKPSELLVVRKDSPIRTGADMNGKTFSSPALRDLFAITTMAWVDLNGGDSKTLHEIELPPAATPAALDAGRVDAAILTEPLLSQTINSGLARVLGKPYDAIAPRFMIAAVVSTTDFINANKDAVQRLARAYLQANAFGNAHPDQTAPWLAELTKVDVATINRGHRELFDESLIPANLQKVIDAAARYKAIDHSFDALELISPVVLNIKA
ncbi:MAG TPA: ABC transporter substrate-binding protein [Candidatus Lustribacter sp.]|nr:ABC transporter substrate-binding protein [Candidatus Lustribacter sp.]